MPDIEVSIVLPCLNEAETLATCIRKARATIAAHKLDAEVVVADNGSTDGSPEIALSEGARVAAVAQKGYGAALRGGIETAQGRYIVMADADDSYDLESFYPFIEKLRAGYDLVMGNRFKGGIEHGAMPWSHRWIGNPVLSAMGRVFFRAPVKDFHCGMRAFSKNAYERMALRTTGMEFASEMVVKAVLQGMRVTEVPTVLRRDGRSRPPHLRSWHDGWRHLRFLLIFSPTWLFLVPGLVLMLVGLAASALLVGGPQKIGSVEFDIHTLLVTGFMVVTGYQVVVFALFTKIFAVQEGLHPESPTLSRLFRHVNLERGLLVALALIAAALAGIVAAVLSWQHVGFHNLDPRTTMREVIPAMVLLAVGVQTLFAAFFMSILGLREHLG